MLRRVPGKAQTAGLAVGFVGIAAIAVPAATVGADDALGVALVLIAVVCYGFAINIAAPVTQRYGSLPVMARMLALAAIWTAPFGLASVAGSSMSWTALGSVAALGIFGTGLAFVLMGSLVAHVGPTRGSFVTYLIPVVATILGVVVLHEVAVAAAIVGVVLVTGGATLASRRESHPTKPSQPGSVMNRG
jgi:drug/metabolite transporter (DMT)-like permease